MNTTMKKRRRHSGSGRSIWMLLLSLIIWVGVSANACAQSGTYAAQLSLRDGQSVYDLSPYIYVTHDPGRVITYNGLMDRHMTGKRGETLKGSVLALGAAGVPHWLVVTISNQSQNESWILNLGEHLDGRIGTIEKIFIYDHTNRKRIIDTVSPRQVPGAKSEEFSATALPLFIRSGQSLTYVMYIVPRAGVPMTLPFNLMSEAQYMQLNTSLMKPAHVAYFLFALVIGFHLAVMLLMRVWGNATFILYFVAQFMVFAWNNNVTYSAYSDIMAVFLALAALVMAYVATKTFFMISRFDGLPFKIIVGVPALLSLLVASAYFLLPGNNMVGYVALAVSVAGGYFFLSLISFAQMLQGKPGALYLALGWSSLFIGSFVTITASANLFTPSAFTIAAYWYALVPQAVFLALAVLTHFMRQEMMQEQGDEEFAREGEQVAKIMKAREGQEFNRLKRLVEHERQVMQELRNREVEQNEEMRQARVAADEANRAKSAFLAVVSHEIRTPMTGIMGMVRLLLDTSLSSSQKDYAQTIQDSGDAMMALLNDILDFEKIESGKMDLERIDFDLHRLANSIITLMSGHANNKNIYLRLNMDPKIPRYVIGDPVRLRQVLLNLVGNSIKFTKEGGVTFELMLEPNSQGLSRGNVYKIRFSVRDTGVGISKEAQHNLFRPFSQADSSVNRKFGGTGLGLAISQRLIEAMGNRIAIDSEEGRGSTFYFTLIMEEGRPVAESDAAREAASGKSAKALRVLVVEDNEINQKLLKEFIQRLGHEVLQALSGEEAIEKVKSERPDMVFMDVELPGISGMGATKAIRAMADETLARTPVIALTGNTREEDIRTCYAANMNGHLAKPVDPLRLRQMIDKVINNKLDNPVEIEEDRAESYTQTTQLAGSVNADEQSAVLRHIMAQNSVDREHEEDEKAEHPSASLPERPLISDLAAGQGLTLELEDELDEDAFEQAVRNAGQYRMDVLQSPGMIFDQTMLNPLKSSMKSGQLQELVDGLLEKAEEIVLALNAAADARDWKTIAARSHELKGMAGNFGLIELSAIAEKLERTAKDNPAADISELIAAVPAAYKRARSEITVWLGK